MAGGPDEELALFSLAVGVLGRVEAAEGVGHLTQHVVQGLFGYAPVESLPGGLVYVEVETGQQGVVVEHLFEVGDQPVGIGE